MKNIDDIFRDQLYEDNDFPTKPEHWSEMQTILDRQNKKRRFWVLLLILFLATGTVLTFYSYSSSFEKIGLKKHQISDAMLDESETSLVHEYISSKNEMHTDKDQVRAITELVLKKPMEDITGSESYSVRPFNKKKGISETKDKRKILESNLTQVTKFSEPVEEVESKEAKFLDFSEVTWLPLSPISPSTEIRLHSMSLDAATSINSDYYVRRRISRFTIMPTIGINRYTKSIQSNDKEYQNRRMDEEKEKYGLNYGLLFGVKLNNVSIQTGVEWLSLGEHIEYRSQLTKQEVHHQRTWQVNTKFKVDTVYFYGMQHHDTIGSVLDSLANDHFDTIYAEIDTNLSNLNVNTQIRYINIPLQVSFPLYQQKRIKLLANIGAVMGIPLSTNASYLQENQSTHFSLQKNHMRLTVNYRLGLAVNYQLSRYFDSSFTAAYTSNINHSILSDHFKQRYNVLGCQIGVIGHF